jgi:hypothetical protein
MLMAVQKYLMVLIETYYQGVVELWKKRNDSVLSGVKIRSRSSSWFLQGEDPNIVAHLCAKEAHKLEPFSFGL